MGTVYWARAISSGATVAVKVLHQHQAVGAHEGRRIADG